MEKLFLSFHFDENGRKLANLVQTLVMSHGIRLESGERLGGRPVPAAVRDRIEKCDCLIALLTEREADRNNQWVRDERAHAEANHKKVIAVVQSGVAINGMYADNERLTYDPADPTPTLLDLSKTLGFWRQETGATVLAQIEPREADAFVMERRDTIGIQYRCWNGAECSDWKDTSLIPAAGGAEILLRGVPHGAKIELQMRYGDTVWRSDAQNQAVSIKMRKSHP